MADNTAIVDSANKAYASGKYEEAIRQYKSVLSDQVESSEIYFNLGNSYFKTNNISLAILNYERAKKKSPEDEDILVNLKIANQKIVDKVEPLPEFFLKEWQNNFINFMSEKTWSFIFLILFTLGFSGFAVYLSVNKRFQKQVAFGISITLFFLSTISFVMAKNQKNFLESKNEAIVLSPSITVKSSPSENGNKLFIIHEGIKVKVMETKDDWSEIKLPNGNVGWLKTSSFISI